MHLGVQGPHLLIAVRHMFRSLRPTSPILCKTMFRSVRAVFRIVALGLCLTRSLALHSCGYLELYNMSEKGSDVVPFLAEIPSAYSHNTPISVKLD